MQVTFKFELNKVVNLARLPQQGGVLIEGAYIGAGLTEPQYYVSYYDAQNCRQTMWADESKLSTI